MQSHSCQLGFRKSVSVGEVSRGGGGIPWWIDLERLSRDVVDDGVARRIVLGFGCRRTWRLCPTFDADFAVRIAPGV